MTRRSSKESMTPRERVMATIRRECTDRPPQNYIADAGVTDALRQRLGTASDEELLQALGVDLRRVVHWNMIPPPVRGADGIWSDLFGLRWSGVTESGLKVGLQTPFSQDTSVDAILGHPWPDPEALCCEGIMEEAARHHDTHATFGSPWCPFFHVAGWLAGQETFLLWMLARPDAAEALLDRVADFYLRATGRFLAACAGNLDIAYFGNDYGTQSGLLVSPGLWHSLVRPRQKRFFDLAHDFGCKVMFHSCGAVSEIVPALVEDGVDILDPLQTTAAGMGFGSLAGAHRDRLAFHGGIDTQRLLPFGTPNEVAATVRRHTALMGGTGYIVMGSQKLIADIPADNILAMYGASG